MPMRKPFCNASAGPASRSMARSWSAGGLLVLLGVEQGDTDADAQQLADKSVQLRIFDDAAGK